MNLHLKSLQRYNNYGKKENFLEKNYVMSFFFRTFVAGKSIPIKNKEYERA